MRNRIDSSGDAFMKKFLYLLFLVLSITLSRTTQLNGKMCVYGPLNGRSALLFYISISWIAITTQPHSTINPTVQNEISFQLRYYSNVYEYCAYDRSPPLIIRILMFTLSTLMVDSQPNVLLSRTNATTPVLLFATSWSSSAAMGIPQSNCTWLIIATFKCTRLDHLPSIHPSSELLAG